MKNGTVKWFNSRKGYGFIKPADGGFDVYVHMSAVERAGRCELKEGQKISFDIAADSRTGEVFAENLSFPPDTKEDRQASASGSGRPSNTMSFIGLLTGQRAFRTR